MGSARLDEIAARQSPLLSCAGAARPTGSVLCLAAAGLIGAATLARAQTTLPTVQVEARKAAPQPAKRKLAAKAKLAPVQKQAPKVEKAETGISHVDGYIARVSGTGSKTDTPLLLIPQSMSVITSDQIEDPTSSISSWRPPTPPWPAAPWWWTPASPRCSASPTPRPA